MEFWQDKSLDSPATSVIDKNDCDDRHFRQVVFDIIERIGKEIVYKDYESNISANDYKHIELKLHAQRVENVLEWCIEQIKLIFYLSHFIGYQSGHLMLFFANNDAKQIEKFAEKWANSTIDTSNDNEFISDLNRCLKMMKEYDATKNGWQMV